MIQNDLSSYYHSQIKQIMEEKGLGSSLSAEVKICTDIKQVFTVLGLKGAKYIAVLTQSAEPIVDSFSYIKKTLSEGKPVSLALFFEEEIVQVH